MSWSWLGIQGGIVCRIWYSKSALGHRNGLRVRVYGSEGSAEWFQMNPEILHLVDVHGHHSFVDRTSLSCNLVKEKRYNRFRAGHPDGFFEAFANYYYDIADALIEFKTKGSCGSPWVFGAELALQGLRMFEAVARASKAMKWEKV